MLSTGHRPKTFADGPTSLGTCLPGANGRVPLGLPKLFANDATGPGTEAGRTGQKLHMVSVVAPVRTFTVPQSWCQGGHVGSSPDITRTEESMGLLGIHMPTSASSTTGLPHLAAMRQHFPFLHSMQKQRLKQHQLQTVIP